jgi:hypothetical protein
MCHRYKSLKQMLEGFKLAKLELDMKNLKTPCIRGTYEKEYVISN